MAIETKRKIFSEYLRKDRLKARAIRSEAFSIFKECIDNAVDEAETNKSQVVEIAYKNMVFSVKNRGIIKKKKIKTITSFEELVSTKYSLRKLTRGLIGHGLKFAIMLSFQNDDDEYKNTFEIHSEGTKYLIHLKNRYSKDPHKVLEVVEEKSDLENGWLMLKTSLMGFFNTNSYFREFVYPFILGNPHIKFILEEENERKVYEKTTREKINKKTDIFAYTRQDFAEFLKEIELDNNPPKSKIERLLKEFDIPKSKVPSYRSSDDLYNFIVKNAKKVNLPKFGKRAIVARMTDFLKDFDLRGYDYKNITSENGPGEGSFSFETVLFSASCDALEDITVIHNGTYYTSHMVFFEKSEKSLIQKLKDEKLKFMVISWSTKSKILGDNKDFIALPAQILHTMENILKIATRKKEKRIGKKEYYKWMSQYETYEKLRKSGQYKSIENHLDIPINVFDRNDKQLIKLLFLNDCMNVIKELVREFRRISIRTAYYQLLSRGYIQTGSYDYFDRALAEARKKGYIPWEIFLDESKPFRPAYEGISINKPAREYIKEKILFALTPPTAFNIWEKQNLKVELWVEKEALMPILEPVIDKYGVATQILRGYSSITVAKEGIERIKSYLKKDLQVKIFYLGDFDPDGWQITKNLREQYFEKEINDHKFELVRLGLNFEQLEEIVLDPLPFSGKERNLKTFEKEFKSRFEEKGYAWGKYEIEAMNPKQIQNLAESALRSCIKNVIEEEVIARWQEGFQTIKNEIIRNLENVFG